MNKSKTWLEKQKQKNPALARQIEEEMLLQSIGDLFSDVMIQHGLNKAELAKRLRTSRAYVTQILSGDRNLSLRSLAKLAYAMGLRVHVKLEPVTQPQGGQRI